MDDVGGEVEVEVVGEVDVLRLRLAPVDVLLAPVSAGARGSEGTGKVVTCGSTGVPVPVPGGGAGQWRFWREIC